MAAISATAQDSSSSAQSDAQRQPYVTADAEADRVEVLRGRLLRSGCCLHLHEAQLVGVGVGISGSRLSMETIVYGNSLRPATAMLLRLATP